jgi:hypothetical protein
MMGKATPRMPPPSPVVIDNSMRLRAYVSLGLQRGGLRATAAEVKAREVLCLLTIADIDELFEVRNWRYLHQKVDNHLFSFGH